jgi:hypothetical protein
MIPYMVVLIIHILQNVTSYRYIRGFHEIRNPLIQLTYSTYNFLTCPPIKIPIYLQLVTQPQSLQSAYFYPLSKGVEGKNLLIEFCETLKIFNSSF